MYGLDINFINDRPEFKQDKGVRPSSPRLALGNSTVLYVGVGIGLILPSLAGAAWLVLQNQTTQLEQKITAIDSELSRLSAQEKENQNIQQQTSQVKAETQALATVFNQIRPWSAVLQDLRDRIPTGVQIESIKQIAVAAPVPSQPASNSGSSQPASNSGSGKGQPASNSASQSQPVPPPTSGIEISGIARSFNDVNDFLLTLQKSPFFKPIETRIVSAELKDDATQVAVPASASATVLSIQPPQLVQYTIQSSWSDAQASELLRELERKGTLGLVTRIRTLQRKGIIQQ